MPKIKIFYFLLPFFFLLVDCSTLGGKISRTPQIGVPTTLFTNHLIDSTQLPTIINTPFSTPTLIAPVPTLGDEEKEENFYQWLSGDLECMLPCWAKITIGKTTFADAQYLMAPVATLTMFGSHTICRFGDCFGRGWSYENNFIHYEGVIYSKTDDPPIIQALTLNGTYIDGISMKRMFENYGSPTEIYAEPFVSVPVEPFGDKTNMGSLGNALIDGAWLDIYLLYKNNQAVIKYTFQSNDLNNETLPFCGTPADVSLSVVKKNGNNWADFEIRDADDPEKIHPDRTSKLRTLHEVAGTTSTELINNVLNDSDSCISVPKNHCLGLWCQ